MTGSRREADSRVAAVCVILVMLCLAVYVPGLSNGFVWDDELYLTRNPAVAGGLSATSLRWAFTTFYTGNWHPLTWISHLADVRLFGLKPWGHHLVNLLFHAANSILAFILFRRMTGALWGSAFLAALFAVHPLHVESVAWVAERKDVLSTFLELLALRVWLGWVARPRLIRFTAVAALYSLALLAKPMPVTFPFLLLLLDCWPLGRFVPGRRAAVVVEKLPLFLLAVLSGAVTYLAQSSIEAVGSVPAFVRLANIFLSYCRYILKALWPTRLALLYPFPTSAPSFSTTFLAVVVLAALTVFVLRIRKRAPALPVGWFWFLGTLVPVIGIVQVGTQSMADRYTYVPLTGLFVMAIWGVGGCTCTDRRRRVWLVASAVTIVVLLTIRARDQVGLWRDPAIAFTNAIRVTRDSAIAHSNLGVYHMERGSNRLAEEEFRSAIAVADDSTDAHGGLAQLLERQGRVGEAIAEYRAALRVNPRLAEACNNLGVLLAASEQQGEAESSLRQALQLRPDFASAHSNLGKLLARQGRIDEALPHFREAVRIEPGLESAREDLDRVLSLQAPRR